MVLEFHEIPDKGLDVDAQVPFHWLDDESSDLLRRLYSFSSPLDVHAHLERTQDNVFVEGEFSGTVATRCVRCLNPVESKISAPFRLTLLPHSDSYKPDREHEIEADDVDLAYYEEERIDLGKVVAEQVILTLDPYPHCRPDCKGLCPDCGADLNENGCECEQGRTDSRWTALKQIKLGKNQ